MFGCTFSAPLLSCCCSSCSLCSVSLTDLCAFRSENSSWTTFAWCFSISCLNSFCACSNWDLNVSRSISASTSLSLRGCTVPRTSWRCFASRRMSLSCSLANWATSPAVICPSSTVSSTAIRSGCSDEGRPSLWNSSTRASPIFLKMDCTWWHALQGTRDDSTVWQLTLWLSTLGWHGVLWVGLKGGWFCGGNLKELVEDWADKQALLEGVWWETDVLDFVSSQSYVSAFVWFSTSLYLP